MSVFYFFLIAVLLLLSFLLTAVILVQESKSLGFGASFGGSDSSDSLFGASTPQVLKVFTGYLATAFILLCIVLSFWTTSRVRSSISSTVQSELADQ